MCLRWLDLAAADQRRPLRVAHSDTFHVKGKRDKLSFACLSSHDSIYTAGCRCNPGPQHVHDAPCDITSGAISDRLPRHDITREGDPKREHCKYLFSEAVHALAVLYQCLSAVLKVGRNKKIRGDIKICQRTFLVCVTCPFCYWISACCCYPCLCILQTAWCNVA